MNLPPMYPIYLMYPNSMQFSSFNNEIMEFTFDAVRKYNISAFKSSFHLRASFVLLRISFRTSTMKYKSEALKRGIPRLKARKNELLNAEIL